MPDIHYHIAMPEPWTHEFHVTVEVRDYAGDVAEFQLPVWTPGSYLIREYSRHVSNFRAETLVGESLPWERTDKSTWTVDAGAASPFRLRYRVYAFDWSVRTSHLTGEHGCFNGTNVFMYLVGYKEAPATLAIEPYGDWHVSIALPQDERGRFHAGSYDELVDSPAEIGTHRRLYFQALDIPHEIAIYGHGNEDVDQIRDDMKRIVETTATLFGDALPYDRYLFIVHLGDGLFGGLEHKASTTLAYDRWRFRPEKKYERFQRLTAHEFFHTWMVKRIRPHNLDPFDYTQEVYTPLLWVMEGFTRYYDTLLTLRAGLLSPERFREVWADFIATYRNQPGRFALSVADASRLAWIKHYRKDENAVNSQISYYLKGGLLALMLDLDIRRRAENERSLDDVVRALWQQYGARDIGFTPQEFQAVLEQVAMCEYDEFMAKYVEGTDELPLEDYLDAAGLRLEMQAKKKEPETWLGIGLTKKGGRLNVKHVRRDGPAYNADVYAQDEIVALSGYRVDSSKKLKKLLKEYEQGETVTLHLFRDDRLIMREVELAERPPHDATLTPVEEPTRAQRALYEAWMGAKWPAGE